MTEQKSPAVVPRRLAHARPSVLKGLRQRCRAQNDAGMPVLDLATGNTHFAPPRSLRDGLLAAIDGSYAYGDARGVPQLRQAISACIAQTQAFYDPDTEVTITSGATGGLSAAMLALVEQGDSVAIFEPYYESYVDLIRLSGANPKFVQLSGPRWTFDERELEQALCGNTRALILNSPHNPTGKVFTEEELHKIAEICSRNNVLVFSDETYAPFTFGEWPEHRSIATMGLQDRTVCIHSWSKVFNAPGWRVGSICAPKHLTEAIRRFNDLATGGPAIPVQLAFAAAMPDYETYTRSLRDQLEPQRRALTLALSAFGFKVTNPEGTLSLFADGSQLPVEGDVESSEYLLEWLGILSVPGSAFYGEHNASIGRHKCYLRFSFARAPETIGEACRRLTEHSWPSHL